MEQLHEYLLKNGWVRGAVNHGEMVSSSTSNLDKWLADFERKRLNPESGLEDNKDGSAKYIAKILAMMPIKKRVPQLEKVMVDGTNVRENLLKHGWFAVPAVKRDTCEASKPPFNQKKEEGTSGMGMDGKLENRQEPKNDIERLLNMLASKKEPTKASKYQGSVDKLKIQENLLKLGWFKKNDEPTASDGDSASNTPVSAADNMTNLDKWLKDFEDQRNKNIQVLESAVSTAVNNDVEKLLDTLSSKKIPLHVKRSQGTMDKTKLRESLLENDWYAAPSNKLSEPTTKTAALDKPGFDAHSMERVKITAIQQRIRQLENEQPEQLEEITHSSYIENVLNMIGAKNRQEVVANNKGKVDKEELKKSLLTKGWYIRNAETMNSVDTTAENPNILNDYSRTTEGIKSTSDSPRNAEIDDVATDPREAVNDETNTEITSLKPKEETTVSKVPKNVSHRIIKIKEKKKKLYVERWLEGIQESATSHKRAHDKNKKNLGKVQKRSAGAKAKSSKKTRSHEAAIQSRHLITVVTVPESTSKNEIQAGIILISVIFGWILSVILTYAGVLSSDPNSTKYYARTDARNEIFFPYPFILSQLQFMNLNDTRNLAILGISVLVGFMLPHWVEKRPDGLNTGSRESRGLEAQLGGEDTVGKPLEFLEGKEVYDIQWLPKWFKNSTLARLSPMLPNHTESQEDEGQFKKK
ncbi:hypothetical protein LOTGIDRAFT_162995 [Lottia gigantea]|uniref:Uncharacterized protein n=1 Tax=Lottia gigantea TaxID=225164 RepID=V4AA91_LOTGI|nr:hypothetical protein LOTGIDRAFT_162995 [Lottia gigantea]ESO91990.1 hypothetical protein LOTGIDRAFT_162995 [Lottia gigantea]